MSPRSLARLTLITSTAVLVLILVVALPVLAARNDGVIDSEGLGHLTESGRYVCDEEDGLDLYRSPHNPRADQSITIRARSTMDDLTSVIVWYTTNADATEQSQWSSITTTIPEASWEDCQGNQGWEIDVWRVDIPAQTSQVWYQIAYADGDTTLWQRASGESEEGPYDSGADWSVASTSLTYAPSDTVVVDDTGSGNGYDRFKTIQEGINAVATGGQVYVHSGFYTEFLTIARPMTLQRYADNETPIIQGSCPTALINVSATPVVIANLTLKVNQATCSIGLHASGNYEQLQLIGNTIESTGSGSSYIVDTRGINLNGTTDLGVTVSGNIIQPETTTAAQFEDGIRLTQAHGTIGGPSPAGNLITAHNAIQAIDPSHSLRIEGNTLYGQTRLNNLLVGSGPHYFISNICSTGATPGDDTAASGIFALLEVNTANTTSLSVQNNEFHDFINYGLFLGNFAHISIEHNTFTPLANVANTQYRDIHLNTKPHNANPLSAATAADLTLWNNTFLGNDENPDGGVGLELANHASSGAAAFQNIILGGTGNDANSFAHNIKTAIRLDPQAGSSDSLAIWTAPSCPACDVTPMAPVAADLDARENRFADALGNYQNPADLQLVQLIELEDRIDHQVDYGALGFVRVRAANVYVTPHSYLAPYTSEPLIKRGIDAADSGDTINVTTGTYNENVVIDKPVILLGMGQNNTIIYPAISNPDCTGGGSGVLCAGGDPAASNLVEVQADDVTVRDLTLDGDAPGLSSGVTLNSVDVDARNGLVLSAGTNLTIRNITLRNIYLDSLYLAGGAVSLSGGTLDNQNTVFDQAAGTITAYANSITHYNIAALNPTSSSRNLRHNWWGYANGAAPNGLDLDPDTDWQGRLAAPILLWSEGNNSVTLGDASLTGGTGTAVIVDHGRTYTDAPFGITIFDNESMCSDYYDFFTVNGSGTWNVSIPVNTASEACRTQTLEPGKIYWIPSDTVYDTECTPYDNNKACWDPITANSIVTSEQNITVIGLTPAQLGGTQFVAGSITGSDPTAVAIIALTVTLDRSAAPANAILIGTMIVVAGIVLVTRRRH